MSCKVSHNAALFFLGLSAVRINVIKRDNIHRVITTLLKYRASTANPAWDYGYMYFLAEDGTEFGDHVAVYLRHIAGVTDLAAYARAGDFEKKAIQEFADFTGMPYDHVVALGMLNGYDGDNKPFDMVSPADVATTLSNYLSTNGNRLPDWGWFSDEFDEDAPTIDEFVARRAEAFS